MHTHEPHVTTPAVTRNRTRDRKLPVQRVYSVKQISGDWVATMTTEFGDGTRFERPLDTHPTFRDALINIKHKIVEEVFRDPPDVR